MDDSLVSTVWKKFPSYVSGCFCCKPVEYDVECELRNTPLYILLKQCNYNKITFLDHRDNETVENKARLFGSLVGMDERYLHEKLSWEVYGDNFADPDTNVVIE